MAEKRMTARKVVCSDLFLHLPPTSQAFYYLMLHNADDDGLVDNVDCLLRLQGFHPTTLSDLLKTAFVLDLGDSVYALRPPKDPFLKGPPDSPKIFMAGV